jgi:quinoprotein glucose dehydrogenase
MSVDSARGLLYLPVSTASNDWYGGDRLGANRHAESLVCLEVRTGRLVWSFQLVHHGLWDYDPAAQPVLITVRPHGEPIDAVVLPGKTGFVYAFDRVTGAPIWPIEERPVPPSSVPGELAHPTQPVPTRPAPFAKQGFTDADVVDFTPELRARALEQLRGFARGPLFAPPSLGGTVVMPGWIGGAGWGSAAFDPVEGTLYVKATNRPTLGRLVAGDQGGPTVSARYVLDPTINPSEALGLTPEPQGRFRSLFGAAPPAIPINRPPYGTMTAIAMDQGEHRWQVTFGDVPALRRRPELRGLNLPPLGVPGAPGAIVTGGGLLFATGGGTVLYALDARDGRVVWQHDFAEIAYAVPMTFRSKAGNQYVVIAVGVGASSRIVAFDLGRRRGAGERIAAR